MSLFGSKCGADMLLQDSDSALLKTQVNLIRLSKVIKNPMQLKQKTGINMYNIHYILQNQDIILEKWKENVKNSSQPSVHSDDCDGIDILILEWVARCQIYKIKLTTSLIKAQLLNLSKELKITPPYYIKPNIWSRIEEILHESDVKSVNSIESLEPYTPLELLKTDGSRLLKPETYRKFLQTIKENALDSKRKGKIDTEKQETYGIKTRSKSKEVTVTKRSINKADSNDLLTDKSNNIIKIKSESLYPEKKTNSSSTSSIDFPPLMAINLGAENKNIKDPAIKEEPLDHTSDEANTGAMRPVLIKNDVKNCKEGNQKEFQKLVDIVENDETLRNKLFECPPVVCEEIKQKSELMADHETDIEIFEIVDSNEEDGHDKAKVVYECPPVIYEELKQEPELMMDDGTDLIEILVTEDSDKQHRYNEAEVNFKNFNKSSKIYCVNETEKELQDLDENSKISNKIIKMEPNDISYQEIQINKNVEADNDENEDIQIVFEIEDSDEEVRKELMEIINKYTSENPDQENLIIAKTDVKQEENESDEEVLTVLEILSDSDDEADNNSVEDALLKELVKNDESAISETNPIQSIKNLKRSRNEIGDNLPSTSKLGTSDIQLTSSQPSKRPCLNFTELTIKSNVEAFKYLHCIKNYFKSQDDKEACRLITSLMMTFMICDDTLATKGS